MVAPREIFARLFINNTYSGLYAIVESVDKQFVGKSFGSDDGFLQGPTTTSPTAVDDFVYRTSNPADYVPLPFKPETHETRSR